MNALPFRFEDVRFSYPNGVEALQGVTLDVPAGQRLGIVGQNGAGKTTLVRHLNGIFQPTSGKVHVGDWETQGRSIAELSSRVGYVFQNPDEQLFAKTVAEDVGFGPRNLGYDDRRSKELVTEALKLTGLTASAAHHPHHLSLSERKRVALAAVLAMDTPVVVLDEPTPGQDGLGVDMISSIVRVLHEQGRTVVAITHDMDFCAENFERVVVMAQGRITADGTPAEVFAQRDVLDGARVEPPQIMRLAKALGWDVAPTTPEEFVGHLSGRDNG